MAILCNGNTLPLTLYFQDKYGNKTPVETIWNHPSAITREDLPVINENMQIGIVFTVNSKEDFDSNAILSLQTSVFSESGIQKEETVPLKLGDTSTTWLYKDNSNNEYPWRMGVYYLQISFEGEKYFSGVFVKPLHLSNEQVLSMHDYLEKQIDGIIFDYIYANRITASHANANLTNYWYYDYARYIKAIQDEFMYMMTLIVKNPVEVVKGGYQIDNYPKRIDRKSIQWGISNKGMSKNSGSLNHQFYLNKKKFTVYKTRENEWIKNVLIEWKYDLRKVKELIKKDYQVLLVKQRHKEEDLIKYNNTLQSFVGKYDVAISTKKDIHSKIIMTQKDLDEMERMINTFDSWFKSFRAFESKIGYFTTETFLDEVSRGKIKPILKKPSYLRIDKMFEESKKINNSEGDKERYVTILKPTWQIYEYFCLFESIEALRSYGLKMISGIDENFLNAYRQDKIPEGSKFIMENDKYEIHIWYDKYHSHSQDEAKEKKESFYIHNSKKRPDIKMDLYEKKENGILMFQHCLIIDAKFRKLTNIHNRSYINTTTEQLTGYTTFFYCGDNPTNASRYAPCVNRVICLYANDEENATKKFIGPITYIKLFPYSMEDGQQYVKGSSELSETIKEWIEGI